MRYSKDHKAETHARIVKSAAVQLREKGAQGIGVADLMKEAGLTHGGFYAHFKSREALVIEALNYAMDRSRERWGDVVARAPEGEGFEALVRHYVTPAHRDNPGHGCTMATLGSEATREGPKARKMFLGQLERMIDTLAAQLPGPAKETREQAIAALATMMGTILMSRVAGSSELSSQILDIGREAALAQAPAKSSMRKASGKTKAKTAN